MCPVPFPVPFECPGVPADGVEVVVKISVQTNFGEVRRKLARLADEIADRATARALNRAVEEARTKMVREITNEFAVKAGYVRQRLRITRATASGGRFRLEAVLIGGDGRRRSANVIAFGARQGRRGLTVKIKRGEPRKVIKGAFIGNKGRTVFRRTGKERLPIEPVRTIDVPQMFNTRRINQAVRRAVEQRLPAILEHELRFALQRWGR